MEQRELSFEDVGRSDMKFFFNRGRFSLFPYGVRLAKWVPRSSVFSLLKESLDLVFLCREDELFLRSAVGALSVG